MSKKIINSSLAIVITLVCFSCSKGEQVNREYGKDIAMETVHKLSKKSIYFGHKSVGDNILSGIENILKKIPDSPLTIKRVEAVEKDDIRKSQILHSYIGENGKPLTKINHFTEIMQKAAGGVCDIAFMKLCYIDIGVGTNTKEIFHQYKNTVEGLKNIYPETTIVHMTVPLTSQAKGLKPLAKKILGRSVRGYEDNKVKEEFNEMLRREYGGEGTVFDLARYESTNSDGTRLVHELDGTTYYSLVPEYTYDGGHLNETGRTYIAEQLLLFLAGL
jgi:hypothetical protein